MTEKQVMLKNYKEFGFPEDFKDFKNDLNEVIKDEFDNFRLYLLTYTEREFSVLRLNELMKSYLNQKP